MPFDHVSGIKLYYELEGSGEPLVFVPGLGGATLLWALQTAHFRAGYRCLSLDNRGAGRSDKPPGPYAMDLFARDLHELLEHLGIHEPINLVGASMGGIIAQAFIHAYPHRVKRLVLACTGVPAGDPHYTPASSAIVAKLRNPGQTLEEKVDTFIQIFYHPDFVAQHPELRALYLSQDFDPQPPHAYAAQLAACFDARPYYDWLAEIQVPTLVIHGREDQVWPLQNAETLLAGLGDWGCGCVIEHSGHIVMQEQAQAFNEALSGFLKRNTAGHS